MRAWLSMAAAGCALVAASAQAATPAERLAARFEQLCLQPPIDVASIENKAHELGAADAGGSRLDAPANVTTSFKSLRLTDGDVTYTISLNSTEDKLRQVDRVGCGMATAQLPPDELLAALSRLKELGPPNASGKPSILRPSAMWHRQINGIDTFVVVINNAFGENNLMIQANTIQRVF